MSTITYPLGIRYSDAVGAAEPAIVDVDTFGLHYLAALESSARVAEACSPLDVDRDDATATVYRLTLDGRSGYAVRPDGELVYVFSLERGRGAGLVERAKRDGAVYLDCFDGYLVDLYSRHGFVEVDRVANWTPGEPDVVYMSLPGFESRHGA